MSDQPKWLEKAKDTFKFHRDKLISNENWRVSDTAKSLRRSIGSTNEDLTIARWSKTHSVQLEKFKYAYEALEFIRKKKAEMELNDV